MAGATTISRFAYVSFDIVLQNVIKKKITRNPPPSGCPYATLNAYTNENNITDISTGSRANHKAANVATVIMITCTNIGACVILLLLLCYVPSSDDELPEHNIQTYVCCT